MPFVAVVGVFVVLRSRLVAVSYFVEAGIGFGFVFEAVPLALAVYSRSRSRFDRLDFAAYACAYAVFFYRLGHYFDRLGFVAVSFLLPYLFQLKKQSFRILFDLLFKLLLTNIQ